jgi:hypothetical protein
MGLYGQTLFRVLINLNFMKQLYILLIALICTAGTALAQSSYLIHTDEYNSLDFLPDNTSFSSLDVYDNTLYANAGDSIVAYNLETEKKLKQFDKPADYNTTVYAGFVTVSPDGTALWTGFTTSGNTDDRIYSIDPASGEWTLKAQFKGNFDLEFYNSQIYVSGLNSSDWSSPNSIYLLDTSGNNNHTKVIETGGNSVGLAIDDQGNIYCGTTNTPYAIYRWNKTDIDNAVSGGTYLTIYDATKLADLPKSPSDLEFDAAGNLLFSYNESATGGAIARWNGTEGDGNNYEDIAASSQWLTYVHAKGDVTTHKAGSGLFLLAYAKPVSMLHLDWQPVLTNALPVIAGMPGSDLQSIDLSAYFEDPDDDNAGITYSVSYVSDEAVASAAIKDSKNVEIGFKASGQANVGITATSGGLSVTGSIIAGTGKSIVSDHSVDFEDLTLADDSYWNGSDGTGSFESGIMSFPNANYGSYWSDWSYSDMADVTTAGYANQYSAITGKGFDLENNGDKIYGVAYAYSGTGVKFKDDATYPLSGFFVTNSTYAALSMEKGDAYAKKFGGADGNDADWFKLTVKGMKDDKETGSVDFYLADFRFDDNTKDYIVKTWQWVDLSSLGDIDSLKFSLSSSDTGDYGINTPAYFCADNFYFDNPTDIGDDIRKERVDIYPVPFSTSFTIEGANIVGKTYKIYDLNGRVVKTGRIESSVNPVSTGDLPSGNYIIVMEIQNGTVTQRVVKY